MGAFGFNNQGQFQVGGHAVKYGKNYIINGGFDYWNYATTQITSGYGSDDRWTNNHSGSTKTHSLVNATDTERALFNSSKFSRTVVTSVAVAGNYVVKDQKIENVTKLAGKTVTISFWAKADTTKNIHVWLNQNFGTGGTPSAIVDTVRNIVALTSTWQKKTITINIPHIVGKTLGTDGVHTSYTTVRFLFDEFNILGSQSGTFDIAEVKLEEGSVATPWTPYEGEFGGELQACQRYFENSINNTITYFAGWSVSGIANSYFKVIFKTRKRVAPTVSNISTNGTVGSMDLYNSASPSVLAVTQEMSNVDSFIFRYGTSGYTLAIGSFTASAEL